MQIHFPIRNAFGYLHEKMLEYMHLKARDMSQYIFFMQTIEIRISVPTSVRSQMHKTEVGHTFT